jgi:hypothetical protein
MAEVQVVLTTHGGDRQTLAALPSRPESDRVDLGQTEGAPAHGRPINGSFSGIQVMFLIKR